MSNWKLLDEIFQPKPTGGMAEPTERRFRNISGGSPACPLFCVSIHFRAKWIREQQWHSEQSFQEIPGGGVELCIPVADFREVKMMILQFGADVEVIAPDALRLEVAEEIRKMDRIYGIENSAENMGKAHSDL